MGEVKIVELLELEEERRWEYLKRYYEIAAPFFIPRKPVVTEEQIQSALRCYKDRPRPLVRQAIPLQEWKFSPDLDNNGVEEGFYSFGFDERSWQSIQIPHSYRYVPEDPVLFGRAGKYITGSSRRTDIWRSDYTTWYKTRLDVAVNERQIAYLCFQSVNLKCDIWVNENPVMLDHLGLHPFTMEITEEIRSKESSEGCIALRVSNTVSNHPFLFYNGFQFSYHRAPWATESPDKDWWDQAWSGIADEAVLLVLDQRNLKDAFLMTERILDREAVCACRVTIRNSSWEPFSGQVRLEVTKWYPKERTDSAAHINADIAVLPMNEHELTLRFSLADAEPWTPDTPNLYLARVTLCDTDGAELDDLAETFGVRTFEARGRHFYLNNRRVVPRGTHNAISYLKESEICPSDHSTVKDILLHKKLGATISRWPSDIKMHHRKIAYLCDQLGLMLTWTGYFEVFTPHPEIELYAERDIPNMITSLRNCPSIVMWELGDEPIWQMHHHRRHRWYERVVRLALSVDESRPIDPCGWFSWDMVKRVRVLTEGGMPPPQARRTAMKEFPIYTRPEVVWDYHYCPEGAPGTMRSRVQDALDTLGGERVTIFTEYGFTGMPEPTPELLEAWDGEFRWATDAMWGHDRATADRADFGRSVTQQDWREVQAAQAIVLSTLTGYLRAHPDAFASFSFMTMFDDWTFYWGLVDVANRPKLAFHVMQRLLAPVWVTGLHGTTVLPREQALRVTVSNLEEEIPEATVTVTVKGLDGAVVREQTLGPHNLLGGAELTRMGEVSVAGLEAGLHSIEYLVADRFRRKIARMLELCFLE